MIKLTNISKRYDNQTVLKDINLVFQINTITSVVGSSGAGKSTLLRLIANLEKPDSGIIKFENEPKIGMVFQNHQLYSHLTVINNLVLPQRVILKTKKKEAIKKAKEVLKKLNIINKALAYPNQLSGGESQRVAIARALVINKNILLFDEPTSALDTENKKKIKELLIDLKVEGNTIIIISHDIDFTKSISDSIINIKNGEITEKI